jgi:hypothetical protein
VKRSQLDGSISIFGLECLDKPRRFYTRSALAELLAIVTRQCGSGLKSIGSSARRRVCGSRPLITYAVINAAEPAIRMGPDVLDRIAVEPNTGTGALQRGLPEGEGFPDCREPQPLDDQTLLNQTEDRAHRCEMPFCLGVLELAAMTRCGFDRVECRSRR